MLLRCPIFWRLLSGDPSCDIGCVSVEMCCLCKHICLQYAAEMSHLLERLLSDDPSCDRLCLCYSDVLLV